MREGAGDLAGVGHHERVSLGGLSLLGGSLLAVSLFWGSLVGACHSRGPLSPLEVALSWV